jgi:hypothetical protein
MQVQGGREDKEVKKARAHSIPSSFNAPHASDP